ncbi:MAG: flavin reductase [Pseudomonadota bacterium]
MTSFDGTEFRSALGSFATGVTIVTTAEDSANPVGVTASSFNSVSLDPPLVLWSLAKKSLSLEAFRNAGHFAIHVLSCHQEELSNAFARSGADKFAGVDWQSGALGSPLFDEFAARFECKTVHQYAGGDHIIFVGEVIAFDKRDHAPLVFHGGGYAEAKPRPADNTGPTVELHEGRFTEDFFLYLLARAHFQTSYRTRTKLAELGVSEGEYLALSVLSIGGDMPLDAVREQLDHTGFAVDDILADSLVARGYVEMSEAGLRQTEAGRALFIEILSVAKAFEDDLLKHLSGNEIAETRQVLKKLIAITGKDIPSLWS